MLYLSSAPLIDSLLVINIAWMDIEWAEDK